MTWDAHRAQAVIGKRIVCGFNFADAAGNLVGKSQRHGTIVGATEAGLVVREASGAEFGLPPDLQALTPARPGTYRLRDTNEVIEDPDFEVVWRVESAGTDAESWDPLTGRQGSGPMPDDGRC